MIRRLVFGVLLSVLAMPALAQHERTLLASTIGCRSPEVFRQTQRYAGDAAGWHRLIEPTLRAHACTLLRQGERVTAFDDRGFGMLRVRKRGAADDWWVAAETVSRT